MPHLYAKSIDNWLRDRSEPAKGTIPAEIVGQRKFGSETLYLVRWSPNNGQFMDAQAIESFCGYNPAKAGDTFPESHPGQVFF